VPDETPGTVTEDQVLLLGAVKERLVRALLESEQPASRGGLPNVDPRLQTIVRDCVGALGQLQAALFDECGLRQRLELDLQAARVALAHTQARLATAQSGTQRARHLALHDGLTTLPNRRHFLAQLHAALSRAVPADRPLALLYIDLDGFKAVNDTHGHGVGDQLLRIVASRLKCAIRAADVVGRLGGDEFACLVFGAPDREQLCRLAGEVHDTVASPLRVGELEVTVRPSIGIATATAPAAGIKATALLAHADSAMYLAKRQRSRFAFFDPTDQAPPSLAWGLRTGTGGN
jgi:diguanylate cyclase (GGDEF)-like protein